MMPTTEAPPPQPPSTEGPPRARGRRGRAPASEQYEGLASYDLLHVTDEIEDERARVMLREKIWIALILHLAIFLALLFAPKYLWNVQTRDAIKDNNKKLTYLDLPPDALKQLKPKTQAPLSDKDRRQQTPKPTTDPKTLRELEAMRRAGPPTPKPAPPKPQQAAPKPQAPAPNPEQAAPAPPKPAPSKTQAPPLPTAQAPAPAPTKPNFSTAQTPGEAVQQAARQARTGSTTYGGDGGADAPSQHPGEKGAVDVLSDTLGVDFGPYIQRVIYDTKRAWYPIIPEIALPPIAKQGKVLIRFKILPDGSVKEMHLEGPSGTVSLDRAAWAGIVSASPFPQLPKNFKGPFLELRFYFLYNDNAGIR